MHSHAHARVHTGTCRARTLCDRDPSVHPLGTAGTLPGHPGELRGEGLWRARSSTLGFVWGLPGGRAVMRWSWAGDTGLAA